jgi:Holliday junction resolvase RusA-like endonuclease
MKPTKTVRQIVTLSLPYPNRILSPNSPKRHWKAKQPAKEKARECAYFLAWPLRGSLEGEKLLQLNLTIFPPNRQRRDLDNVHSALKSALDGMCKGLGVDDSQICRVTLEWGAVVKGGQVDVDLRAYHHSR